MSCITRWLRRSATCPVDRSRLTATVPSLGLRGAVEALQLRCCPNEPPPVAGPSPPGSLPGSPPRAKRPRRCREEATLREGRVFAGLAPSPSPSPSPPPPPPRCGWSGPLGGLAAHLQACGLQQVACTWAQCEQSMPRHELAAHVAWCAYATVKCASCDRILWHDAVDQHVQDYCPATPVACSVPGCGVLVRRDALAAHEARECPHGLVSCPVAGCAKRVARGKLQAHVAGSGSKAHVRLVAAHLLRLLEEQRAREAAAEAAEDEEDEEEEEEEE
jgi:hypothetical protein